MSRQFPIFQREVKALIKKYASLKGELAELIDVLANEPTTGISLGKNCYKIRIAISSKGKGKSGGARIITCFLIEKDAIYLLSIYDKSDQNTITPQQLESWVNILQ